MNHKNIIRDLLILIVILFLVRILRQLDNPYEQQRELFSQLDVQSTICQKYLDYENHAFKTIVFCNENKEIHRLLEMSGFYDFAETGDSIIKHSADMKIRILRKNIDTTFTIKIVDENPEIFDLW